MKDNRIQYMDIAKGIVLILVVWHHAQGPFTECIRAFHMPFFFLVSGMLYNQKDSFWVFTRKKLTSLYIPFAFWNIVFYIGTHLDKLHLKSTWRFVGKIVLTLDKESEYLGATWFLGALFTECVLYKLCDTILSKVKRRRLWITLLFVCRALFAFYDTLPYKLSRTLILGMFFAIGVVVKEQMEVLRKYHSRWFVYVAIVPFFVNWIFNTARYGR